MDYTNKKRIIDELSMQMTGKIKEEQEGKLTAKFNPSTNSVHFLLTGTDFSMEDISRSKHYLTQVREVSHNPEERLCCDVAITCIDSIINQFIKDLNIPLAGTS